MSTLGSMLDAKAWARKYQYLFPDNELFPSLEGEEENQLELVVDAKLAAYQRMLDAKIKRLRAGQPLDQP